MPDNHTRCAACSRLVGRSSGRTRGRLAVAVAVALLASATTASALTASPRATPGALLDANYPTHDVCRVGGGWIPDPGQWAAQTFTAARSGELTDAILPLATSRFGKGQASAKVTIVRTGAGGRPVVSDVLATATASVPFEPGVGRSANAELRFSPPARVSKGDVYAIVVTQTASELTSDGYLMDGISWFGDTAFVFQADACASGTYAGGRAWTTDPDPNINNAAADFFFWTYVKPTSSSTAKPMPKKPKPPLCKKGQRSTKTHPCRKR